MRSSSIVITFLKDLMQTPPVDVRIWSVVAEFAAGAESKSKVGLPVLGHLAWKAKSFNILCYWGR